MSYICKKKNREGTFYTFLCEGYRIDGKSRQRTLKYFGKTTDEEFQDLKRRHAKGEFDDLSKTKNIVKVSLDLNSEKVSNEAKNIGWKTLQEIYDELNITKAIKNYSKSHKFKYSLDEVMQLLVFCRILYPDSKANTINEMQHKLFGNWDFSYNDIMRSLDHFYDLQEELQIVMHKSICENIGRSAYLVFYDVTNYYFETDIDDEDETDESGEVVEKGFRKRGPSKEHKPNPIVQMGLFMDSNGIPIAYELFEGNFVDPVTYIPAIEQVKKQFGIERIVTVADKAMNSAKNVTDAHLKGDGWLFSQKFRGQKGAPKDIQNFVLDKSGWEYNKDMSFAKKSVVKPRKLSNGEMVDQKILVTWREKYAVREKIRRDGALEYANSLRNPDKFRMTMRRGGKKYLKMILQDTKTGELVEAHPYFDIDQELADDDARFDGMNVIVTSETSMSDEEMIASYGRLNTIEDCFRVTKTDLKARPVFVWTKKHIEAHFLTCFVALTIIKILHYKLQKKYSTRRIIKALKSMKISEISNGIVELFKNETAYSLQNDLGNEICNRYYKIEDVMRM